MHNPYAFRIEQNAKKFSECRKIIKREKRSGNSHSGLVMADYKEEYWLPWHMLGNAHKAVEGIMLTKVGQYREKLVDFNFNGSSISLIRFC